MHHFKPQRSLLALFAKERQEYFQSMNTQEPHFFTILFQKEMEIAKRVFNEEPALLEEFFDQSIKKCLHLLEYVMLTNSRHLNTQNRLSNNNKWEDANLFFEQLYCEMGTELFEKIPHSFVNNIAKDSLKINFSKELLRKGYQLHKNTEVIITAIAKGDKELFDLCIEANSNVNPESLRIHKAPLSYKSELAKDLNKEEKETLTLYFWNRLIEKGANVNIFSGHNHFLVSNASQDNTVYFEWLLKNNANHNITWSDNMGNQHTLVSFVENNAPQLKPILDRVLLSNVLTENNKATIQQKL